MATKLIRRVVRVVAGYVITLSPEGMYLRESGRRLTVGPLPYGALYQRAVMADVARKAPKKPMRRRVSRGLLSIVDPLTR